MAAPKTTKAASASSSSADKGKKRVRVTDDAAPAKSPKTATRSSARKDLKDKSTKEIEPIHAADAPEPAKSALKKSKAADKIQLDQEEEDDEAEEGEGAEGEIDFLAGFEESGDDGADSSDEEDDAVSAAPFKLEALPSVDATSQASVQKKLEAKAERKKNAKTGTIYLGRIPHGFHEAEMRSYFSQFGEITRLRLSRNKSTGASKHYAFIEFQWASVAQIVSETMDNYLLAGHILVCKVIPESEIHPKMWIGANRKFRPVPKGRRDAVQRAQPKSEEQQEKIKQRLLTKEQQKRDKLKQLGIDYDFAGYAQKEIEAAPAPASAKKEKKVKAAEPAKKKARKLT